MRMDEPLARVWHNDAWLVSSYVRSPSGLGDPLGALDKEVDRQLSESSNFLMFLRLRRDLGLGALDLSRESWPT